MTTFASGFLRLDCDKLDDPLFAGRLEQWVDLLARVWRSKEKVDTTPNRELADAWGWGPSTVGTWLKALEEAGHLQLVPLGDTPRAGREIRIWDAGSSPVKVPVKTRSISRSKKPNRDAGDRAPAGQSGGQKPVNRPATSKSIEELRVVAAEGARGVEPLPEPDEAAPANPAAPTAPPPAAEEDAYIAECLRAAHGGMAANPGIGRAYNPIPPGHGASRGAVQAWIADGIALVVAVAAISQAAQRFVPSPRSRQVNSLSYFDGAVRSEAHRCAGGGARASPRLRSVAGDLLQEYGEGTTDEQELQG